MVSRLAVLSDTNPVMTARLTRMVVKHDPQVLLFAGDHHPTRFGVSHWSARSWRRSIGVPLKDRVIAVPGNHDFDPESGLEGWHRLFDAAWPQEAHREGGDSWFLASLWDIRVIGLDTGPYARGVTDEQLTWLERLDPARIQEPVIALAHSPLAPVSVHIGRGQDTDPVRRDRLIAALHRLGVRTYLCGHEHLYAHRTIAVADHEPIHQFTLGGGGASSYEVMTPGLIHSVSEPHVALIDVAGRGVTVTALDANGVELDVVHVPKAVTFGTHLNGHRARAAAEHAATHQPSASHRSPY